MIRIALYAIIILAFAARSALYFIFFTRNTHRKDDIHFAIVYGLLAVSYSLYILEGSWAYAMPWGAIIDALLMIVLIVTTVRSVKAVTPSAGDAT